MLTHQEVVQPKTRGFISFNSHPIGLRNKVTFNIKFIGKYFLKNKFKEYANILILGSSTGYGFSTSLVSRFGLKATNVINVFFDRKPIGSKTASAGWYNMSFVSSKFELKPSSNVFFLNEDVFLKKSKRKVLKILKTLNLKLDLLVYSIASPKRLNVKKGLNVSACLKPTIRNYTGKTINLDSGSVINCLLQVASIKDILDTKYVMGGEDWFLWVSYLNSWGSLSNKFKTIAYSYIGPEFTWPIYKFGTIGEAKKNLFLFSRKIYKLLNFNSNSKKVFVFLNKAVTTQASSAIPVVPLYLSILYKHTRRAFLDEQCLGQITRVFCKVTFLKKNFGVIRLDEYEIEGDLQKKILYSWLKVDGGSINTLGSFNSYRRGFLKLFGFCFKNTDYSTFVNKHSLVLNKLGKL